MIESLEGRVIAQKEQELLLQVGPVGLRLNYLARQGLLPVGSTVRLYTHFHFKEEAIALFAFRNEEELALFRRLLAVSGIGPKTAQAMVAYVGPQGLGQALQTGNPAALLAVPGIGKKTAAKILFDLRGTKDLSLPAADWGEALEALVALGFTDSEARERLAKIDLQQPGLRTEELIREALQK